VNLVVAASLADLDDKDNGDDDDSNLKNSHNNNASTHVHDLIIGEINEPRNASASPGTGSEFFRGGRVDADGGGGEVSGVSTTAAVVGLLEVLPCVIRSDSPSISEEVAVVITIGNSKRTAGDLKDGKKDKKASNDDEKSSVQSEVAKSAQERDNSKEEAKEEAHVHDARNALDRQINQELGVANRNTANNGHCHTKNEKKKEANAHNDLGHIGPSSDLLRNI